MNDTQSEQSPGYNTESVDAILTRVPELACESAFDRCLITSDRLAGASGGAPSQIDAVANRGWLARVHECLAQRRVRAESDRDGEIVFLCDSLLLFLTRMPAREHPFVIALYLRSLAKRDRLEADPPRVGAAMDQYSMMLARDERE